MCGRYILTADLKKVADRFGAPMREENTEGGSVRGEGREDMNNLWRPRYNIAPMQAVIWE